MRKILPKNLIYFAEKCTAPLYVVGGSVRDFLSGRGENAGDLDICAPLSAEAFAAVATDCGFTVCAVYKNTGTVKLKDETGAEYEFAAFRSDKYVRGEHTPAEIFFTDDIRLDARRRDFTANAIYYEIAADRFVDPLGGIKAVKEKRLTTVDDPEKVFGEDGLRLMRLARQTAQLGFSPDESCLWGATKNASLIDDVSPERIFEELRLILNAEARYGVANGCLNGLLILEKTRVLDRIFPELTLGRGMAQRADFHKYDVLFHSLKATAYAPSEVRLAVLLHDVGKPFCTLRDGHAHEHPKEGAAIAEKILTRLRAPKKTVERVKTLVEWHMYDFDCKTSENKLRRFFVSNAEILDDLLKVKQADFSGCTDDLSIAPTVRKWQAILEKMKEEKVPFSLRELPVTGKEVLDCGIPPKFVSLVLNALLLHLAVSPKDNVKERVLRLIPALYKNVLSRAGTR